MTIITGRVRVMGSILSHLTTRLDRGGGPGEGIIVNPLIKRPVIAPQTVLLLQFGNRGNLLSEQEIGERKVAS